MISKLFCRPELTSGTCSTLLVHQGKSLRWNFGDEQCGGMGEVVRKVLVVNSVFFYFVCVSMLLLLMVAAVV